MHRITLAHSINDFRIHFNFYRDFTQYNLCNHFTITSSHGIILEEVAYKFHNKIYALNTKAPEHRHR